MKTRKPKYKGPTGRPELWLRGKFSRHGAETVRIIYPDGYVEYNNKYDTRFTKACTSADSYELAHKNIKEYEFGCTDAKSEFLGYL